MTSFSRIPGEKEEPTDALQHTGSVQTDRGADFQIQPEIIPLLVEESLPSGSTQANPREATREACTDILKALI